MIKTKQLLYVIFSLFLVLAVSACTDKEDSQPPEQQELTEQQKLLVQELNQWLIPLNNSPLLLTDSDLSFLDNLSNSKLVALGEATHGTQEFFQMKHRIFKYLVENVQHVAFGFEADFGESLYFDNYICGGGGELEELMKTKMHFWTWRTEEVKQLLEWMKDYNSSRSEEKKIHYYGFDCQYFTYQPGFLQEYLEPILPDLWDTAAPLLEQVKNLSTEDYLSMSDETYNDILTQLESLENQFIVNKDLLVGNSSPKEYEIHRQLLITFKQAFIVRYHSENDPFGTNWRDKFMAENSLWIADFLGQDAKITLWAHNNHIANDEYYNSMGYHLREKLDNLYQTVGFSFSRGSFTAFGQNISGEYTGLDTHEITDEPQKDSINLIFHHASTPDFAFHLDAIPSGSQWDAWLQTPRPFLSIGASFNGYASYYYKSINLRKHFNWIIHFDSTTASKIIQYYLVNSFRKMVKDSCQGQKRISPNHSSSNDYLTSARFGHCMIFPKLWFTYNKNKQRDTVFIGAKGE